MIWQHFVQLESKATAEKLLKIKTRHSKNNLLVSNQNIKTKYPDFISTGSLIFVLLKRNPDRHK